MNPQLRYALFASAVCVVAMVAGWQIADGSLVSFDFAGAIVGIAGLISISAILVKLLRLPLDVIILGLFLIGYLVGNRGFAQLTPMSGLPLFPAEIALLAALGWRVLVWAHERKSPVKSDAINTLVLIWLVVGSLRLPFDVPKYGFVALRDFAMVYYALFFFAVQHMVQNERALRFLQKCLLVGLIALPFFYAASLAFPNFFLNSLVVRGSPLIYYKGDLALVFLGIGSLMLFFQPIKKHRVWARPLATILFIYVVSGDNRASMVALVGATLLLLAARRWHYAVVQITAAGLAATLVFGVAVSGTSNWADKKFEGIADRARSLVDVRGTATYQSEDSANKGDNNQFRLVWWKSVFDETLHGNPVFGLGFGHDLARGFVHEYYVDSEEEFTTRSPHNIFLSIFGRMGLVGLAVWFALCGCILRETWRALKNDEDQPRWALWGSIWIILISATFGVVLEGPMGAIVFWTLLGLSKATVVREHLIEDESHAAPLEERPQQLARIG